MGSPWNNLEVSIFPTTDEPALPVETMPNFNVTMKNGTAMINWDPDIAGQVSVIVRKPSREAVPLSLCILADMDSR